MPKKRIKVQLITPKNTCNFRFIISDSIPPLGLLSIASYLKKKVKNIDVEILNCEILGEKEVIKKIDADFVGLSTTLDTYRSALKIARVANKRGAKVLLGGVYANTYPELILHKRKFIDGIILRDGEIPFYEFVIGKKLVHNLVYRKDRKIIYNPMIWPDLDQLFPLDYSLLDIQKYIQNYMRVVMKQRTLNIYSKKGCYWKNISGGCTYCAIPAQKLRAVSPKKLWQNIMDIKRKYDLELVVDHSDQFVYDTKWLKEFAKITPKDAPKLVVFSRVNDITEESVKLLKKMNCITVLLGIESCSQKSLKSMRKGTTVDQNERAVNILAKNGMFTQLFLIAGVKGETKTSLNESYKGIKKLISYGNVDYVEAGIFGPIPGSPSFNEMITIDKFKKKYANKDLYTAKEHDELVNDWISHFCKVKKSDLVLFLKKIELLIPNIATKEKLKSSLIELHAD